MTGISMILFSLLFFHSDCVFDYVIHTFAKFHGEVDGIYCGVIESSILKLWIII